MIFDAPNMYTDRRSATSHASWNGVFQRTALLFLMLLSEYACASQPRLAGYLIDSDTRIEARGHLIAPVTKLEDGTYLSLIKPGQATVYVPGNATKYVLTGPGRYRITQTGIQELNSSHPPVRVVLPSILGIQPDPHASMDQAGVAMRSANTSSLAPNNAIVKMDTVQLSWQSRPHKGTYRIRLENSAGNTLFETRTDKTFVIVPQLNHFNPGTHYSWTLYWQDASLESETAQFVLVSKKQFNGLKSLRESAQTSRSDRALFNFLLMALLYKSAASNSPGPIY